MARGWARAFARGAVLPWARQICRAREPVVASALVRRIYRPAIPLRPGSTSRMVADYGGVRGLAEEVIGPQLNDRWREVSRAY